MRWIKHLKSASDFSSEVCAREFYFPQQNNIKEKKTTTTIAWKVARKANQPIKAGDPLSYTPVTVSKTKRCVSERLRENISKDGELSVC